MRNLFSRALASALAWLSLGHLGTLRSTFSRRSMLWLLLWPRLTEHHSLHHDVMPWTASSFCSHKLCLSKHNWVSPSRPGIGVRSSDIPQECCSSPRAKLVYNSTKDSNPCLQKRDQCAMCALCAGVTRLFTCALVTRHFQFQCTSFSTMANPKGFDACTCMECR